MSSSSSCEPTSSWMASAEKAPEAFQYHGLCHPTISLLRKMRSDVCSLLESYIEKQGLDAAFNLDSIDGVPAADAEPWSNLSEAERLGDNLKAYWSFQVLLDEILEEQRSNLTPTDVAFHQSIQSVILQVSALAYQLEELIGMLKHKVPAKELESTRVSNGKGLFEKKIRGMKVLQELAQWTVRSIRDLHQISKSLQATNVLCASQQVTQGPEK